MYYLVLVGYKLFLVLNFHFFIIKIKFDRFDCHIILVGKKHVLVGFESFLVC